jgi:hypothetical protein
MTVAHERLSAPLVDEVVHEDAYRLCYVRGRAEGILIGLTEPIG